MQAIQVLTFILVLSVSCSSEPEGPKAPEAPLQGQSETPDEEAPPKKRAQPTSIRTIAVFGDSISTGMLADVPLGQPMSESLIQGLKAMLPNSGDFIGFITGSRKLSLDEIQSALSRPNLSAFTGERGWSHAERLQKRQTDPIRRINLAKIGARIADASQQVDALRRMYINEDLRPAEHLIFEFGANDFCLNTDPQLFASEFESRLKDVVEMHPKSRIIVTGIPDVFAVKEVAPNSQTALMIPKDRVAEVWPDIPQFLVPESLSCGQMRRAFDYCEIPVLSQAKAKERLARLNGAIAGAVADVAADYAEAQIRFIEEVTAADSVTKSNLAADCFHPSEAGQRAIADATFDDP